MNFLWANAFSITCVLCSAYLVTHGSSAWGWFLVIAVVTFSS